MSAALSAVALCVQAGVPVLVWGPPGSGKTSGLYALSRWLDWPMEVVIASLRDPSDFAGLPVARPEGVTLHAPSWAHRLSTVEKGLLYLDELTTCAPAVQAALLRVVFERVVGDQPLSPGVSIVAAANPPEQAAGGWDLAPPLANRFCHVEWAIDAETWGRGMRGGWPVAGLEALPRLPSAWHDYLPQAVAEVADFVDVRPQLLLSPPMETQQQLAWPSPRTWDMLARLRAAWLASGSAPDTGRALAEGCVGRGAAAEFLNWLECCDLPSLGSFLGPAATRPWPARADRQEVVLRLLEDAAATGLWPDASVADVIRQAVAVGQVRGDLADIVLRRMARSRRFRRMAPGPSEPSIAPAGTLVTMVRERRSVVQRLADWLSGLWEG